MYGYIGSRGEFWCMAYEQAKTARAEAGDDTLVGKEQSELQPAS
jgi:hypothetical protein